MKFHQIPQKFTVKATFGLAFSKISEKSVINFKFCILLIKYHNMGEIEVLLCIYIRFQG